MTVTAESEVHPVLALIAGRLAAGGGPGVHGDGHRLALAIEGGGMRGTITAGMALGMHELGLTSVFDDVYGSSAGAITGAWLCSDVMDFGSVLASPLRLHVLATDAATGEAVDPRSQLNSASSLRRALRASCALPLLAGPPVELRGRFYLDAGLSESIPYRTAIAQGATHVLVLSSRRAEDVVRSSWSRFSRLAAATVLRPYSRELRAVYLSRAGRLAADDVLLREGQSTIFPIRPAGDSPQTGGMASDSDLLRAAFEAGRSAVFNALGELAGGPEFQNISEPNVR